MSFLDLDGKTFLISGVANRRSVAWHVAKTLISEGANIIYTVHSEARRESLHKLIGDAPCLICDVENQHDIVALGEQVKKLDVQLHGFLHSIAFANYSKGVLPFHETKREDFQQALQISAFSFVEMTQSLLPHLNPEASCVTIGISDLNLTAENYGYMSPIKSALTSMSRNLAKSLSHEHRIRVNVVGAGPLKTNSSAGIPGFMDNYLFAEKLTFRKEALGTQEVANTTVFLLSPSSSGINGAEIIVDAGMNMNSFDQDVVRAVMKPVVK
jgi:enoyl-[acyl-carrier protein] reductase I